MEHDRDDERVSLHGVDPEEALRALLAVDPASEPVAEPARGTGERGDAPDDKPE